jgi:hypothetical protein
MKNPGAWACAKNGPIGGQTVKLNEINRQADVAQLVEQPIRNRQVIGSSPIVGSILFNNFSAFAFEVVIALLPQTRLIPKKSAGQVAISKCVALSITEICAESGKPSTRM